MSARIDPELARHLNGSPDVELEAIIMAASGLDDLLASLPADVVVEHSYNLIASISVTAPAGALRRLAEMPTVKSIEPVRQVRTC